MSDEDKSFEATPHKLKKAREQGQIVKSQDLSTAAFLVVMFLLLFALAPFIWNELATLFVLTYEQIPLAHIKDIGEQYLFILVVKAMVVLVGPFLLVGVLMAIAGNVFQFGLLITTKTIEPKFDKLNPVKGFKNLFQMNKIVELIKNILKVGVLGLVGWMVFSEFFGQMVAVGDSDNPFALMSVLGALLFKFILLAGLAFFLIGLADFLYQRFKFMKDQKMSFKEMKDEYKSTEGDPHVKAKLRQRRMQMLQQRMLEAVPSADVITTNPIHIAVALQYNADTMESPKVVAKGTERFAELIIQIGQDHGVPVVQNPPIARALFRLVDIDQDIPPDLYQAVAEILLFAWRLKGDTSKLPQPFTPGGEPPVLLP
jgi:flagellar biosynthetic protein FlhB